MEESSSLYPLPIPPPPPANTEDAHSANAKKVRAIFDVNMIGTTYLHVTVNSFAY